MKNNIKSVLCINDKKKPPKILKRYRDNGIDQLHIDLADTSDAGLVFRSILDQCYDYISSGLQTHNVLVHCGAGVSRSPSVTLHYLVKSGKLPDLLSAVKYLMKCRPCMDPNSAFLTELVDVFHSENSIV